jgi:hypothetical protein
MNDRTCYVRYLPLKGPDDSGQMQEEELPLQTGETLVSTFHTKGYVGMVLVMSEKARRRHSRGYSR